MYVCIHVCIVCRPYTCVCVQLFLLIVGWGPSPGLGCHGLSMAPVRCTIRERPFHYLGGGWKTLKK